jgi:polar amino acid transport system substrate-binding protein
VHLWKKAWVCAAISAVMASSALADALEAIKLRGKLLVGVSETTPPFSFRGPGENTITGYDIDLVQAVTKRIGVALEMVPLSSAERIPLLQQGNVDLVATSMTRTRERERDIDFSYIYFITPHAVIVRKVSGITSVRQLAGRKASSASTSTAGGNLKEVVPDVNIVYVRDYSLAFAALKEGSVDAFTTDETVLTAIVRQDGHPDKYLFLPDFTKSREVGFALKKERSPNLNAYSERWVRSVKEGCLFQGDTLWRALLATRAKRICRALPMLSGIIRERAMFCCFLGVRTSAATDLFNVASD